MFNSGVVTTILPDKIMWTSTGYPPWNAYYMWYNGNISQGNRFQGSNMYIKTVSDFLILFNTLAKKPIPLF